MKTQLKLSVLASFLMLFSLSGCYFDFDDDNDFCEKGKGSVVSTTYVLPPFSGVSNAISGSILIRQGESYEVTVRSEQNIIDEIAASVKGDLLVIDTRRCINNHSTSITITTPTLSSIANFGSAHIYSPDIWTADEIDYTQSGSGAIEARVDCNQLNVVLSGSGNITLSGQTAVMKTVTSGSGNINAFGVQANAANVTITGSGNTSASVNESLTGTISGSGNIYYRGFPETIDVNVSGSGGVINRN